MNNSTPNQEGENQTSPSILNYYLNPLPGLGNFATTVTLNKTDFVSVQILDKYMEPFESEPE